MAFKNALIIDDDPVFAIMAEEALLANGLEHIRLAENGRIGVDKIIEAPSEFDLVICDLQMPTLDGISVLRELGQVEYSGAVIIVSGEKPDILQSVFMMARMAGIQILGTLSKPLNTDDLRDMLAAEHAFVQRDDALALTKSNFDGLIENKKIIPVYQPKLDIRTGRVYGVEVLSRILGAQGEHESATPVLNFAEDNGCMNEFTLCLIDAVIADACEWAAGGVTIELALNISPTMLRDRTLPDTLATRFQNASIKLSSITLEITEDQLISYEAGILEVLSRLRLLGFRLSLDDFGTGATSIEQLRRFPFNEMKIDQSFVQGAATDEFAWATLETSTRLAAISGMTVVAEGVETAEQMKQVTRVGAHTVQGYLISPPLTAPSLTAWLRDFDPASMAVT